MRIVNQPFPAPRWCAVFQNKRASRFPAPFKLLAKLEQAFGVLFRRRRIVDGARANHDQQPIVVTFQDLVDRFARMRNGIGGIFGSRNFPGAQREVIIR